MIETRRGFMALLPIAAIAPLTMLLPKKSDARGIKFSPWRVVESCPMVWYIFGWRRVNGKLYGAVALTDDERRDRCGARPGVDDPANRALEQRMHERIAAKLNGPNRERYYMPSPLQAVDMYAGPEEMVD